MSDCLEVSDICPVSRSIYGYRPNFAATVFFLALFAAVAVIQAAQGIYYRTWTFMIALSVGCICEAAGYGGRLMLYNNVFDDGGFDLQISLLTLAPAFLAAGIYLMLKHLVLAFGASFSRLPPRRYTHIFITCDFISLVLQAAGGAIAATANKSNESLKNTGNDLMMAGLSFQVFTLLIFGALVIDYASRAWKNRHALNPRTVELRQSRRFRVFVVVLITAFFAILMRCVYRIAEMARGWANPIMRNEPSFIAFDSCLCALTVIILTIFHPGLCFNYRVVNADAEKRGSQVSVSSEDSISKHNVTPNMS